MKAALRLYKRIFRYPLAAWCLFISFGIGYLSIFYGTKIFFTMRNEREHKEKYSYIYERGMFLQSSDSESRLGALCEEKQYHIAIRNFYIFYDKEATSGPADIVMNTNGEEKYPIVQGMYPDETMLDNGEKIVLLGKGHKDSVYERDGKEYIEIFSEEYRVLGYLSDGDTVLYDYQTVLFYGNLGARLEEELKSYFINGIEVSVGSDSIEIPLIDLLEKMTKAGFLCTGYSVEATMATEIAGEGLRIRYLALIYLFAMINCVVAEEFCLTERMREIAIRKMFGYSLWQLAAMLYKELVGILIPAALGAATVGFLVNPLLKKFLVITAKDVISYMLLTLFALLLSGAIVVLFSVSPLKQTSAAEFFRRQGDVT